MENLDKQWQQLEEEIADCRACGLCEGRKRVVPGEGNRETRVLFVGEGPGAEEDRQGRPFVGPAGQLLDRMLEAVGLRRDDVFIANVVKCRPPGNRTPTDDEAAACLPFLRRQTRLLHPEIIVCMGGTAVRHLIDRDARVSRQRGLWVSRGGVDMLSTYHPAALLRREEWLIDSWRDMMALKERLARGEGRDGGE